MTLPAEEGLSVPDASPRSPHAEKGGVAWSRVALFYGLAFGMVAALGLVFWWLGVDMTHGAPALAYQLTVAFLYMPMPLIAGLVVDRVAGRPLRSGRVFTDFRHRWLRIVLVSAGCAVALFVVNLGLTWLLGTVLHVPGVGQLVSTREQVLANLTASLNGRSLPDAQASTLPSVPVLYLIAVVGGLVAGFTVNGLFAFGEEYGWRGVLMDELAPLGRVRANVLTGVLWGVWHAPIILLGYNCGVHRLGGVVMMCAWLIPFSFLLYRLREYCGSVLPAAIVHGAFNGCEGFFVMFVASGDRLVSAPVGMIGVLSTAIVALVVWVLTRGRLIAPLGRERTAPLS